MHNHWCGLNSSLNCVRWTAGGGRDGEPLPLNDNSSWGLDHGLTRSNWYWQLAIDEDGRDWGLLD